jgi:hypothetical protein
MFPQMRNIRAAIRFTLFFIATFGLYALWFLAVVFIPNKIYWRQSIFKAWAKAFAARRRNRRFFSSAII